MVDRIRYPTVSYLPFYYIFFQFLLLTIFNLQANILTTKDILSNLDLSGRNDCGVTVDGQNTAVWGQNTAVAQRFCHPKSHSRHRVVLSSSGESRVAVVLQTVINSPENLY